jgi:hypothetical protein
MKLGQIVPTLFVFGLFLSSCSSGPELEKYPVSEIDRPYTLPKGVATWHIPTIYQQVRDNHSDSTSFGPIILPFEWETALSDDWTLTWIPVPLQISHQFWNDENSRFGMSFTAGFSYSSNTGFRLAPTVEASYRLKLNPTLALEFKPYFTPDMPFQTGEVFRYSYGLSVGPLFQLTPVFALEPNFSFDVHRGSVSISDSSDPFSGFNLEEETIASFGVGLSATWSIGRQWDFRPSFNYRGLASKNGYRGEFAVAEFVYYW